MLPEIHEVKRRRKALGITQFQLAKEANISQSLVAKMEAGNIEPSYSIAKNVFLVLDKLENKNSKMAKDYRSKKIIKIDATDKAKSAIGLMKKNNISQLPVFEGQAIIGSFSEKTILDRIATGESIEVLEMEKVADIMDDPFPTINDDTPVNSFISLLQHNQALVVLKKGKPIGIITKSDMLKR